MANIRHVVVVRKDLQLSPGLLAAQVAHISDKFMRERIIKETRDGITTANFTPNEIDWLKAPYLSVLAVNCPEDLKYIMEQAIIERLQYFIWEDLVPSPTFPDRSVKAFVGLSIGPDDFDKIKIVTGALPLY